MIVTSFRDKTSKITSLFPPRGSCANNDVAETAQRQRRMTRVMVPLLTLARRGGGRSAARHRREGESYGLTSSIERSLPLQRSFPAATGPFPKPSAHGVQPQHQRLPSTNSSRR